MKNIFYIIIASLILASCNDYSPKPYAYFRIELPEHAYDQFDSLPVPCTFEVSKFAKITPTASKEDEIGFNINYPSLDGRIYCTYVPIKDNFRKLSEDDYKLVSKHDGVAEATTNQPFENPDDKVYGILYDIQGNAASPLQFVLTDSVNHFFRASVYFDAQPNSDSIAPVAAYIKEDVKRLIESFKWK